MTSNTTDTSPLSTINYLSRPCCRNPVAYAVVPTSHTNIFEINVLFSILNSYQHFGDEHTIILLNMNNLHNLMGYTGNVHNYWNWFAQIFYKVHLHASLCPYAKILFILLRTFLGISSLLHIVDRCTLPKSRVRDAHVTDIQ
jgi:hypothetical protein